MDSTAQAGATPAADPAAAAPSTSKPISSFPSGFVPRAVKKRTPASSKPTLSSHTLSKQPPPSVAASTSTSLVSTPPTTTTSLPSPQEVQRLEQILVVIESSFSDHGLTCYKSSGLLDKFKSGVGWIHLSQILAIAPVRALTSTLVDLKNAVGLRDSKIIKADETGYSITRRDTTTAIETLEKFELADWDDLTLHLENIPFNTSLNSISPSQPTSFSLLHFLSTALETPVQKLLLPALYDPKNPPNYDEEEEGQKEDGDGDGEKSQADAFRASMRARQLAQGQEGGEGESKRKARGLPRGGGGFKGFTFIVLKDRDEVERVLKEWSGSSEGENQLEEGAEQRENEDVTMGEDAEEEVKEKSSEGKGKAKADMSPREKAKRGGLKAMSYSRWLELKQEYLAYRRTIEKLLEAQASGELDQLRNPPDVKDQPPHLQRQQQQQHQQTTEQSATEASTSKPPRIKRASSPSFNSHSESASSSKRTKRASSPSSLLYGTPVTRHTRKLRTPSPLPPSTTGRQLDLTSDVALTIQGAYPEGCVLWVRNVHEKSSKTSLKSLFGKLLDDLQEGSGKGVEFVDYEKGLETCYIRFSSAPLASLTESHLLSTITYHLSQHTLSPVDTLSEAELTKAQQDLRRPIAVELLRGEQERQYWASLPESTRKAARLGAGGKVGLVKEPRGFVSGNNRDGGADGGEGNGFGNNREASGNGGAAEPAKKRKKPSRM